MSSKSVTLKVLTPTGTVFEGAVEAVFLPGTAGPFEVLPDHAPIVTTLEKGRIEWRKGGELSGLGIERGAAILDKNVLTACVEGVSQ